MSTSGPTHVVEVNGREVRRYVVAPRDAGLEPSPPDAARGGRPDENAAVTRAILDGALEPGDPQRDLALLNAGAAIYAAGRAPSIADGVEQAARAVDSGAAARTLEAYVALSRELAEA